MTGFDLFTNEAKMCGLEERKIKKLYELFVSALDQSYYDYDIKAIQLTIDEAIFASFLLAKFGAGLTQEYSSFGGNKYRVKLLSK